MAYDAKVLPVMIASPSDVSTERQIVRDTLAEWNAIHSPERRAVLLPVGWETHSSPELAGRPQQIINERLLEHCDLLVGIFWTRVGSSTGKAISGSVEEIQRHRDAGKPALLYFSEAPVAFSTVDKHQMEQLEKFRAWAKDQGLFATYETIEQFRADFPRHLRLTLRDNPFLQSCLADPSEPSNVVAMLNEALNTPRPLSADAETLLQAAVAHDGEISLIEYLGGAHIEAGQQTFEAASRRQLSRWKAAIDELRQAGLIVDQGYKGELFEVTHSGYQYAETKGWPAAD